MATVKISAIPALPTLADADLLAVVDDTDTTTKKGTALQLRTYINDSDAETLTFGATVTIDLDPALPIVKLLTVTGNFTFATTNRVTRVREASVRLVAVGGPWTITYPAWHALGAALTTTLPAGKVATLSLRCYGTLETDVDAVIAVEP